MWLSFRGLPIILPEIWIFIQSDFWWSPDRLTDRRKVIHMSPPCNLHRWAQKWTVLSGQLVWQRGTIMTNNWIEVFSLHHKEGVTWDIIRSHKPLHKKILLEQQQPRKNSVLCNDMDELFVYIQRPPPSPPKKEQGGQKKTNTRGPNYSIYPNNIQEDSLLLPVM